MAKFHYADVPVTSATSPRQTRDVPLSQIPLPDFPETSTSGEVSARAHEYVGLIDIMHSATLHGIGVITKLYFAILRHLRNQWPWISLRGHSRSYILAAIESLCMTLYRPLIVTFALSSTVLEILIYIAPACRMTSEASFIRKEPTA